MVADHCLRQRRRVGRRAAACRRSPKQCRSRSYPTRYPRRRCRSQPARASASRSSLPSVVPVPPPVGVCSSRYPHHRYWLPSECRRRPRMPRPLALSWSEPAIPPRPGTERTGRSALGCIDCAGGAAHAGAAAESAAAQAGTQLHRCRRSWPCWRCSWRSSHPKLCRHCRRCHWWRCHCVAFPADGATIAELRYSRPSRRNRRNRHCQCCQRCRRRRRTACRIAASAALAGPVALTTVAASGAIGGTAVADSVADVVHRVAGNSTSQFDLGDRLAGVEGIAEVGRRLSRHYWQRCCRAQVTWHCCRLVLSSLLLLLSLWFLLSLATLATVNVYRRAKDQIVHHHRPCRHIRPCRSHTVSQRNGHC